MRTYSAELPHSRVGSGGVAQLMLFPGCAGQSALDQDPQPGLTTLVQGVNGGSLQPLGPASAGKLVPRTLFLARWGLGNELEDALQQYFPQPKPHNSAFPVTSTDPGTIWTLLPGAQTSQLCHPARNSHPTG